MSSSLSRLVAWPQGDAVRAKLLNILMSVTLALFGGAASAADGGNRVLTQLTPHDRLYAVAFDGDYGVAVGHAGLMIESTDGGVSWKRAAEQPPTKLAMHGVAIANGHTVAVGQMGLVLVREARGAWRKVESGSDQRLLRVSMNSSGLAIAVGAFGTLLKSTDHGATWQSIAPAWAELYQSASSSDAFAALRDEPTNYVVKVFDDGVVLVGGEYGQINRSTDAGATWTAVYQADSGATGSTPPTIFGMNFRDDGVGYAAGQDGLVIATRDHGQTWERLPSGTSASLFDIQTTADGQVIAVGQRAGRVSHDGGKTWQAIGALDLGLNWYSALGRGASTKGDSLIAVGHSGRIVSLVAGRGN